MALDKYAQLKIAGNILGFTMKDFSEEVDAHPNVVRRVCEGRDTSARISKLVDQKIKEADEVYQQHRKKKVATISA